MKSYYLHTYIYIYILLEFHHDVTGLNQTRDGAFVQPFVRKIIPAKNSCKIFSFHFQMKIKFPRYLKMHF